MLVSTKVFCYIITIIIAIPSPLAHLSNLSGHVFPRKYPALPKFPPNHWHLCAQRPLSLELQNHDHREMPPTLENNFLKKSLVLSDWLVMGSCIMCNWNKNPGWGQKGVAIWAFCKVWPCPCRWSSSGDLDDRLFFPPSFQDITGTSG